MRFLAQSPFFPVVSSHTLWMKESQAFSLRGAAAVGLWELSFALGQSLVYALKSQPSPSSGLPVSWRC